MSSDVAIRVEGLGKDYLLGQRVLGYSTLRETLSHAATRVLRRGHAASAPVEVIRALDDLTFTIQRGDTVGFIGHNGAGKSTLLKILSRITEPTRGFGEIRGRVGALLEVGTGFHPELTGRENIFLNGAVLGMRSREIQRRFDEIVAFAEVERFLDTPVKRYSSGMTVRLAFAVAAHLEPEVLIVDEVLAVGDTAFQRRCLDRMAEVAQEGRTVLFVSHNMSVVRRLCRRAIVLERGRVVADAGVEPAVTAYLATIEEQQAVPLAGRTDRKGYGLVRATSLTVRGEHGAPVTGSPATIEVGIEGRSDGVSCRIFLYDQLGLPIATIDSGNASAEDRIDAAGSEFRCEIEELPLVAGHYRIDLALARGGSWQDVVHGAATFAVGPGQLAGRSVPDDLPGATVLRHRWVVPGDGPANATSRRLPS
jgi:lipopolysaccharide transport system ATP-binding protein